jgi:diphosphomevalonate decarboxylase
MRPARATAHANIALVKYWGKRAPTAAAPRSLNLPAVGSLSMTLDGLRTDTDISQAKDGKDDFLLGDQRPEGEQAQRVFDHLDRLWDASAHHGARPPCHVQSTNSFPTAAGLASSASGFAALTLAGATAFDLATDPARLCALARMGSGSAPRSLWGGFVRLERGDQADGSDCMARQVQPPSHWDLRMIVVETASGPKALGSTNAMERCRETSPYYQTWVETSAADLEDAERALAQRDLPALGRVMEHSFLKMHAVMLAAQPPVLYWNETTIAVMHAVWDARNQGLQAYVTSDAGPHVKVLCAADLAPAVTETVQRIPGVKDVLEMAPGPDAFAEVLS